MSEKIRRMKVESGGFVSFICTTGRGSLEYRIEANPDPKDRNIAGLEAHYASCPDYRIGDRVKPDHDHCWLTNCGPCWHDGTSLYCNEHITPNYLEFGEDWLWPFLEREYADRFEGSADHDQ